MQEKKEVYVHSDAYPVNQILNQKYEVDFYQRDYVWGKSQIEDFIGDLSTAFLDNWKSTHKNKDVLFYTPYFLGEIVLSTREDSYYDIIDGQQRLTTFTLLLIFIKHKYGHVEGFPETLSNYIYSRKVGEYSFNINIEERMDCMQHLYDDGIYNPDENAPSSVINIVERYNDIEECWNDDINEQNIVMFVDWLTDKVMFSQVTTNSDEFAYVIFETMNDRGLSLTQVEMLRSYILTQIEQDDREEIMNMLDSMISDLTSKKLKSNSKAEFEFFKLYFRSHLAEDLSQSKNSNSDFIRIGKEFHRWVRDSENMLGLTGAEEYKLFVNKLLFFAKQYMKIIDIINDRQLDEYLHVVVNADYGFTLQPALLLAAIDYGDDEETISEKIKLVSKYLTKVLSWRIWNQYWISQSKMEAPIYDCCKDIRGMNLEALKEYFSEFSMDGLEIDSHIPRLNQQNKRKFKILISLITEIVALGSKEDSFYAVLDNSYDVEHIWADHYERHADEGFEDEAAFQETRSRIGDLLVLPSTFNKSYNDSTYEDKVKQYFSQNILAQTLNSLKYENNPGFVRFMEESSLPFSSYNEFKKEQIDERTQLYRGILKYHFSEFLE